MAFNVYRFVADNAGLDIFTALTKAYEQGKDDATPTWTFAESQPPKEKRSYLVWLDSGSVCECRWTDGDYLFGNPTGVWHWNFIDLPQHTKVVALMPMPKKPHMEGERE